MAVVVITSHSILADSPIQDLAASAPHGWMSFHLVAGKKPKEPKEGKKKDPYEELQRMMRIAREQAAGRKTVWESGQQQRAIDPARPPSLPWVQKVYDRDNPRSFVILPILLADLRRELPDQRSYDCIWLVWGAMLEEDNDRNAKARVKIGTQRMPYDHGDQERQLRTLIREMLARDPLWAPDYKVLAADFPAIAPARDQAGNKHKDRTRWIRLIVAEERKAASVAPPPRPTTAADEIRRLRAAGVPDDQIRLELLTLGWDVSRGHVRATIAADDRRAAEKAAAVVVEVPTGPITVELGPGVSLADLELPDGAIPVSRPSPRAEPLRVREDRELADDASAETTARELLRRGASYDQVRAAMLERGRMVPDASMRRMATELRRADLAPTLDPDRAASRSDMARALLARGAGYDDVERGMRDRGAVPLSRGQLRAIKASLKG